MKKLQKANLRPFINKVAVGISMTRKYKKLISQYSVVATQCARFLHIQYTAVIEWSETSE